MTTTAPNNGETTINNSSGSSNNSGQQQQQPLLLDELQVIQGLERLAVTLQDLNDKESAPQLSHYRLKMKPPTTSPAVVSQAYELLRQGASLVHATSTKYTLMGKIASKAGHADASSSAAQQQMANDLLQGCQVIGTACLLLHQDSTGCCRSVRHSSKQAARAIVQTVLQLVQCFYCDDDDDESALQQGEQNNNVAAQRTGAVWEMCNTILEKRLSMGNRNAMRRDLFVWMQECNETMQEFQQIIDAGPVRNQEDEEETGKKQSAVKSSNKDDDDEDAASWEAFLDGQEDDQYTAEEFPIATACIAIIKCSRGSLNTVLQACEVVGGQLKDDNEDDGSNNHDKVRLQFISTAHDMARIVGEGMTDLGATLYPPLHMEELTIQVEKQSNAIKTLLNYVLGASPEGMDGSLDLTQDVNDRASKLNGAIAKRREEAVNAIAAARNNNK